jgi:hypothetical protein
MGFTRMPAPQSRNYVIAWAVLTTHELSMPLAGASVISRRVPVQAAPLLGTVPRAASKHFGPGASVVAAEPLPHWPHSLVVNATPGRSGIMTKTDCPVRHPVIAHR